jgi:2-polyprenyl-3-methyl-5-hydroxy-6-metoxy-1,4-benzoquinol methylase
MSNVMTNDTPPLVSIVIPCYNHADFLRECLESLLAQTLTDWEAIVVDDASTEGNPGEVVVQVADPRIRVIRHDNNRGLAASRNTGFRAARAHLVLPLDADDKLDPHYLDATVETLQRNADADCVFTDFQLFGADTDTWRAAVHTPQAMLHNQWIPGAGALMRRALWERVGGYCEADELRCGNEDWDFWLSATAGTLRALHVPQPLYQYRQHTTSMVSRLMYFDCATREFIYQRHRALFDQHNAGRSFLAAGYLNSARASWKRRELWRTLRLLCRHCRLCPSTAEAIYQTVKTFIPSFLWRALRKGRRLLTHKGERAALWQSFRYRSAAGRTGFWDKQAEDIDSRWGKSEGDYAILKEILTRLNVRRLLDVGCGSGRLFPLYQSLGIGEIVGQDIAQHALELARNHHPDIPARLLTTPITELPFPPFSFDIAICNRVLQHIPPSSIAETIAALCRLSRHVYLNELSTSDGLSEAYFMFKHDYPALFAACGFAMTQEGLMGRQHWQLFANPQRSN